MVSSDAAENPSAAARRVLVQLLQWRHGALLVHTPGGDRLKFGSGDTAGCLRLHSWQPFDALLRHGAAGLAQSYRDGDWVSSDLPGLLALLAQNGQELQEILPTDRWQRLLDGAQRLLGREAANSGGIPPLKLDANTAFFRLWLDPTMSYSAAYFGDVPGRDLLQAQLAKQARVLAQLALPVGSHLLEVDCGWGSLTEAACRAHLRVTALTQSAEQQAYAAQRLRWAGLDYAGDVRLSHWRNCRGQFDAVAAIEILSHLAPAAWPGFFAFLAQRLKPGARACLQSELAVPSRTSAFCQRTPLPNAAELHQMARGAGLEIIAEYRFGADYLRTLAHWRSRLQEQDTQAQALAQGLAPRCLRGWDYHLSQRAAGYLTGATDVTLLTLRKPARHHAAAV